MKYNFSYIRNIIFIVSINLIMVACTDDFLKPDPLSFYEPSKIFTTQSGLESVQATCDKHLRNMFFHNGNSDNIPLLTEYYFSDLGVSGITDSPSSMGTAINMNMHMTPTASDNANTTRYSFFWDEGYKGIKYANSIISNITEIAGIESSIKNEMLGKGYFYRAIKYYNLIFQFKDVPLFTQEVRGPKFDYRSTKRSVILDMITKDLEFAVQNVPATPKLGGMVTKGTCRQLLIKCYLSKGEFDKAIAHADTLINMSGYKLMTEPFGEFIDPMPSVHKIKRNVIWDLHRPENKIHAENKEVIHCMINRYGYEGSSQRLMTMRNCVPFWVAGGSIGLITPTGKQGMDISREFRDYKKTYGRGIAKLRPTNFAQYDMWLNDKTDLRHSVEYGNWMHTEELEYNHPNLFSSNDPYAGKKVQLYDDNGKLLCTDTIRNWFGWPHYKIWIEDPIRESELMYDGGEGDWYMFRLAETYLLRAEAYMWKGENQKAADDVNEIRKRAKCEKLFSADEMNMGIIMDERARELYLEEWRHVELSRVSYIFALTGQSDEFGQTYTEETLSDNSYWWQRVCKYNNFYNSGIETRSHVKYTISPYHIFFPIPQSSIDGNRDGVINQNKGYAG